jgi:hypothetical protein
MKGNITEQKLRQGQTVYTVHANGKKPWMNKLQILGKPFMNDDIGMFVLTAHQYDWGRYEDLDSLDDRHIWPHQNKYNNHRAFYSRKKAEKCLARFRREELPAGPRVKGG